MVVRDPAAYRGSLRRFARAAGRLDEVEAAWLEGGGRLEVHGSRGQPAVYPFVVEMRQLEEHVEKLTERLHLTLPARAATWPGQEKRARLVQAALDSGAVASVDLVAAL